MAFKTEEFSINITGTDSEKNFGGKFKVRVSVLPHGMRMEQDRLRREFLGTASPESASAYARNAASIFSELSMRVVEAPSWWADNGNGLGLEDDNVVAEVWGQTCKLRDACAESVQKRAEAARKDLEKAEPKE